MLVRNSYELEAKTWAAGQKLIVHMAGLPENHRTRYVALECEFTINNGSGGSFSATSTNFWALLAAITNVDVESPLYKVRSTAKHLTVLYRHMRGKWAAVDMPSINAASSGTWRFMLYLPMSDDNQLEPNDTAQPTGLLEGKNIELQCASTATIAANVTITTGLIRPVAYLLEGNGDTLPAATRIDYEDWNQATALLKPGVYSHLFAYDESDNSVDPVAEYERIRVQMDGRDIVDRLRGVALVADYNHRKALGGWDIGAAATVGGLGEDAIPLSAGPFIPILTPGDKYKLAQLPAGLQSVRADIVGTATGARFGYRMVIPRDQGQEVEALQKLKVAAPERVTTEVKTASKLDLQGAPHNILKLRRILPLRFFRAA